MLQRVGIAQAIVHDPKIVFLDEPMSGLDPLGRREIRELLQELKDQGKTVFFSTHILSDAEALCDRVAVIHKGELRGIGVVEDLQSKTNTKTEVVWQGSRALASVAHLVGETHTTGETIRAVASAQDLDVLLEKLRQQRAQLISVSPVHGTLEDYFLAHTSEPETAKI
jgi:ABC-2 type transport system ATP-binding protein